MSKQLMLMLALTALGTVGVFILNPLYGVLVYYIFSILRPQDLWMWVLPEGWAWSYYVGLATLFAAFFAAIGGLPDSRPAAPVRPRFGPGHYVMFLFGLWICVTYVLALNQNAAYKWFMDYVKIVLMFAASAILIRTVYEVRTLMYCALATLAYLCFEINLDYFQTGHLKIYFHGHGGLDNNGAGLLLAMSVPLFYFMFEAVTGRWRWLLLGVIPVAVHAVQMTFSRGAMLSLIVAVPLVVMRSRYKKWLLLGLVTLGPPLVYITAGKEIQERFFSIKTASEMDDSAKARLMSWTAALKIASEYPIFGVGVRNSNLISHAYGADMEGRTIHSTYLQIAADNGFVGLGIYLLVLLTVWRELRRVRHATFGRPDPENRLYYGMTAGIECSMLVFCFGSIFLSMEVFELPYMLMMCGSQLALLHAHRHGAVYDAVNYAVQRPPEPVGV